MNKKLINKIYDNLKKIIKLYYKDVIFLAVFAFVMFYNFPYVVYRPGGTIKVNERMKANFEYDMEGTYHMNYVTVAKANIPMLIGGKIFKSWDIEKMNNITMTGLDYETTFRIEQLEMENSITAAKIIAYQKAGENIALESEKHILVYISPNAKTDLKLFDEILEIDGKKFKNIDSIREYINTLKKGDKVKVLVNREGKKIECTAKVYEDETSKLLGISFVNSYTYKAKRNIDITRKSTEAGSSGGLMLSLTIYDALIKEDLSKGKNIMGTGTIDVEGNVGEIGGVKYKLLGAEKNHADIFFIPKNNYKEAKKVYDEFKLSFKLVKVDTIDDAINYLHSQK